MARTLDLSGMIVVVSGGRAGRQILNHLVTLAEGRDESLIPPQIITVGHLLEHLFPRSRPAPDRLRRLLTWPIALKGLGNDARGALLRRPPDESDFLAWMRVGAMLDDLHTELAGHGVLIADAAKACPAAGDAARWEALAQAQELFLRELERAGFADPTMSALLQVKAGQVCSPIHIVLVSVPELPGLAASALRLIPASVSALIVAPGERAEWFDDLGCVIAERWGSATVDLSAATVRIVDGPDQQADAAIEALGALGDRFATDEVVIGVPDAEVVPYLEARAARPGGVRVRSALGVGIRQSGPFKLMEALCAFTSGGSFRDWATLLRHPSLEAYLAPRLDRHHRPVESWLTVLDDYATDHIPRRVTGQWFTEHSGRRATLETLYEATRGLLGPLWPDEEGAAFRPLAQWAEPILAIPAAVYGGTTLNASDPAHRTIIEACEVLQHAAEEMSALPPDASSAVSAAQALGTLLMLAEDSCLAPEPDPGAVELLGWLELAFDDAGAVVVTGLNEGRVPSATRIHPLLPDSLCTSLGLPSGRSHAARDVYLLSVLAASRADLTLIAARRTRRDDPLRPSRLLFACGDNEILDRVRRCVPAQPFPGPRRLASPVPGAKTGFPVAPRAPFEPVTELRVTAFRSFLRSPYGFFLEHVRRLEERCDLVQDLDPGSFGTMVHETLRDFALGPAADSGQESEIKAALRRALEAYVAKTFGPRPPVAVQLQHIQAGERLDEFAALQASWRQKGWRIVQAEWSPEGGAPFVVDDSAMLLRGTIDRIDRHDENGHYIIIDYKTSEKGPDPRATHRTRDGEWIDLQLPLYRHLAATIVGSAPVQLAYIVIPGQPDCVKPLFADWTDDDLRAADDTARRVIREIRAGEFFELGAQPPDSGILGSICGQGLVESGAAESEDDS